MLIVTTITFQIILFSMKKLNQIAIIVTDMHELDILKHESTYKHEIRLCSYFHMLRACMYAFYETLYLNMNIKLLVQIGPPGHFHAKGIINRLIAMSVIYVFRHQVLEVRVRLS